MSQHSDRSFVMLDYANIHLMLPDGSDWYQFVDPYKASNE